MAVTRDAMPNADNGISSKMLYQDICQEASSSELKDSIQAKTVAGCQSQPTCN
jgi:hypothetical protein